MPDADYLVGVEEYELAFVESVLDDDPVDSQTVYKETIDMPERAIAAVAAMRAGSGGGGGGASALVDLTDVTGGAPQTGEAPVWDGDSFELTNVATQAELDALSSVYQPVDSDLTAIAALTTTAFGRALLALADQAALLSAAGAAAAVHAHAGEDITSGTVADARIASTIARDSEVTSAISALSTVYQPLDSDLTSIAALTTTSFGRAFLALADAAATRTAIGLVIGTDVEAHDTDLTTIAGLSPSNDDIIQRKAGAWANRTIAQLLVDLAAAGTTFQPLDATLTALAAANWAANSLPIGTGADALSQTAFAANTFPARAAAGSLAAKTITDFGLSLVDDADAATARATLGLVIGTNVQAQDAELAALAGLTSAADKGIQFTGSGTAATFDLTTAGKAILDDADAAAQRTTLAAAPSAATYICQVAESGLSAEQSLGALATGILKSTTSTGVLSIAAAGTDYRAASITQRYPVTLTNPRSSTLAGNSFFTVLGLTDWDMGHWQFVKDVQGKVYGYAQVPPGYVSGGALKLDIAANATSGVTRLNVATKSVADGSSLNPTLTDETAQDITVPGTAYLRKVVSFTLTETLAASSTLIVEIFHEGDHTNDTLAVNTLLLGVWLECVSS